MQTTTPPSSQPAPAAPVVSMCFSLVLALGKTAGADTPDLMDHRNSVTVSRLHEPAAAPRVLH